MAALDETFLAPFISGTLQTLDKFCGVKAKHIATGLKSAIPGLPIVIAGAIGITGKNLKGAMFICFPEATYLSLVTSMLGETHGKVSPENCDAAAELSNIIFGTAKVDLNTRGYELKMALPYVLFGEHLEAGFSSEVVATSLVFEIPAGKFVLEFTVQADPGPAKAAVSTAEVPVPRLDANVLMSFVTGVRTTFATQFKIEPAVDAPFFKTPDKSYAFDIGGTIGVTSVCFGGTYSLYFEKAVFLKILETMLGETCTELTSDLEDAAAELVNITFGLAKQVLNAKGYALVMALPTLVRGSSICSVRPGQKPAIVLPFRLREGAFWAEFAFEAQGAEK